MKFLLIVMFSFAFISNSNESNFLKNVKTLDPCPNSPNCVSTQEQRASKRMKPINYSGIADDAISRLKQLISDYPEAKLVAHSGTYFHYEFRTKVGRFVDDVEFLVDTDQKVIHFRSASRVGFGDFGKNRRRMKKIIEDWDKN